MSSAELTTFLIFAAAMSFSPGPNVALTTALAANFGFRRALRFCVAVPVGWTLLMLLCGLGVGVAVTQLPVLHWAVKLSGAGYLLWLARRLSGSGQLGVADPARLNVTFVQGVLLQFANIKAWMLALTATAGWVVNAQGQVASNPTERLWIVCGVMMFMAFVSNLTYALVGALLRQWLATGSRLLWFNRGLAAVLVLTALWMLTV
jgi:threonine/homoserine/homoserine lactone efflux protein